MERFGQSVLHPAGAEADTVAMLWWIMLAGSALVTALVLGLVLYVALRDPSRRRPVSGRWLIVAGGVVLPVVPLTSLLFYSLDATARLRTAAAEPALTVEVQGHRWWWEVRYPGEGMAAFTTANHIQLPVDTTVRLRLTSQDVIHSFWVPNLAGKLDLIPGVPAEIILRPTRTGLFRGQCAEYCGAQHANMALHVEVVTADAFDAWRTRSQQPATFADEPLARRGEALFHSSGCVACHTIHGSPAHGRVGPDLTRLRERHALAAGTLPANRAHLSAWIVDAQHFKPGSLMPSFTGFSGADIRALVAYLEGLQ